MSPFDEIKPPYKGGSRGLRRLDRNRYRRDRAKVIRELTPEEKFDREQFLLWFKLHHIFSHKEYVSYDSLPDKLKKQIKPFDEFIYPHTT